MYISFRMLHPELYFFSFSLEDLAIFSPVVFDSFRALAFDDFSMYFTSLDIFKVPIGNHHLYSLSSEAAHLSNKSPSSPQVPVELYSSRHPQNHPYSFLQPHTTTHN